MFQTTTHGTIYQISSQRSLEWKPKEKNIQIPIWLDSDTHYLPKSKDSDTQVPQDRIRWSLSFDLVKTLLGSISTLEVNIAQAIASHRSQCHTLCHPRGKSLVDSLASWQASENSLGLLENTLFLDTMAHLVHWFTYDTGWFARAMSASGPRGYSDMIFPSRTSSLGRF